MRVGDAHVVRVVLQQPDVRPGDRTPSGRLPSAHRPTSSAIKKRPLQLRQQQPNASIAGSLNEISRTGATRAGPSRTPRAWSATRPRHRARAVGVLGLDHQARPVRGRRALHETMAISSAQGDQCPLVQFGSGIRGSRSRAAAAPPPCGRTPAPGRGRAVQSQIVQTHQLIVGAEVHVALQAERDPRLARPLESRLEYAARVISGWRAEKPRWAIRSGSAGPPLRLTYKRDVTAGATRR